ncbi:MAG: dynamin family protein [Bacteroidales bacterium]|nr:dynamin family protein [Bacteroidales bacterium]
MAQNFFEELQEKKQNLKVLATKAKEYGWIDADREQEIIEKLNNDVLTIGVIGQMKCGKSTFLNSFVFEDDVLPAATTPMTAALSVITYGEDKKIVAEFYTKDEWEEQKVQAMRSLDDVRGNALEESKVKAAKELVEKSSKLGTKLYDYLGKTQEDSFEHLIEYVGADGRYISITKSVTIYYPVEYLKGVEIVDTPGFNDPIVSREERTKAFLNKADVVLLMLYAGRPFDATDRDILFKNVAECGTGKVLIGINKYDIPAAGEKDPNNPRRYIKEPEDEEQIKQYVKDELIKACKDCNDNLMKDILRETEPIPLSAEMALLSELPMSVITSSDAYSYAWNRDCEAFDVSSQKEMRELSHLDNLVDAIKHVVEVEKEEILIRKPLNAIVAAGNKRKDEIEQGIQEASLIINALNQPDDELDEMLDKIKKANRRMQKKVDTLGEDIQYQISEIVRKGRIQLEDSVDGACNRMYALIDGMGRFSSAQEVATQLQRQSQSLVTRTLKREVENISENAKGKIKSCIEDFLGSADDILMKYLPDYNSRDFIKKIEREINVEIEDNEIFDSKNAISINDDYSSTLFGNLVFGQERNKASLSAKVDQIKATDVSSFLDTAFSRRDAILSSVKAKVIDNLILPLEKQLEDIVANKDKKNQKLQENKEMVEALRADLSVINEQIKSIM